MVKTKTMKPETKTKKKLLQPLPVLTAKTTFETITMEQCKTFFYSEMDIFSNSAEKAIK